MIDKLDGTVCCLSCRIIELLAAVIERDEKITAPL